MKRDTMGRRVIVLFLNYFDGTYYGRIIIVQQD